MGARELFVWYRLPAAATEPTRAAVLAMQRELVDGWPGLAARVLVRAGGETATWMETYSRRDGASGGAGIDAPIEAAIAAAARGVDALAAAERHVEAFEAIG